MKSDEDKRLKEPEIENSRLKRLIDDTELNKPILKKALGETAKPDAET
jgi:hypothetical protein